MKVFSLTCFNPIWLKHLATRENPNGIEVPCGKCLACKIAKSHEWALRCMHEMSSWDDFGFITLTYSDDYLPDPPSVRKVTFQNFIKRYRQYLLPSRIKYYACGEYGDLGRPHYHSIIFGDGFNSNEIDPVTHWVMNGPLKDAWPYGNVFLGVVTYDSCRYVAGYIDKKYYGQLAKEMYISRGLVVPFQLCSSGLGYEFAKMNKSRFEDDLCTTVHGVKVGLPRYYKNKLDLDPVLLSEYSVTKNLHKLNALASKGIVPFTKAFDNAVKLAHEGSVTNLKARYKHYHSRSKV